MPQHPIITHQTQLSIHGGVASFFQLMFTNPLLLCAGGRRQTYGAQERQLRGLGGSAPSFGTGPGAGASVRMEEKREPGELRDTLCIIGSKNSRGAALALAFGGGGPRAFACRTFAGLPILPIKTKATTNPHRSYQYRQQRPVLIRAISLAIPKRSTSGRSPCARHLPNLLDRKIIKYASEDV